MRIDPKPESKVMHVVPLRNDPPLQDFHVHSEAASPPQTGLQKLLSLAVCGNDAEQYSAY